jgi:hypothetical protein
MAEAEIKGLRDELERLQHQLREARAGGGADADLDHSPLPLVPYTASEETAKNGGINHAGPNAQSWSLSFGLWNFLFSYPQDSDSDQILRV